MGLTLFSPVTTHIVPQSTVSVTNTSYTCMGLSNSDPQQGDILGSLYLLHEDRWGTCPPPLHPNHVSPLSRMAHVPSAQWPIGHGVQFGVPRNQIKHEPQPPSFPPPPFPAAGPVNTGPPRTP